MLPSLVSNPYLRGSIILILNWWIFVGTTYYTWFQDQETPIILVYLRQEFQILKDTCQGLRFCVHIYYLVQVLSHSYQVHVPMYLFGKKKKNLCEELVTSYALISLYLHGLKRWKLFEDFVSYSQWTYSSIEFVES